MIFQQNYPMDPLENISRFAHVRYLCLDMIRKALDILPIPIAIFTAAPSINNITFLTYIYIYIRITDWLQ